MRIVWAGTWCVAIANCVVTITCTLCFKIDLLSKRSLQVCDEYHYLLP